MTQPSSDPVKREFTLRAVITAIVVAAVMGAAEPYVVLKIGYGPNISLISAFFGYMALGALALIGGVKASRFENNLVQTAGTAAGQAGFMCVVLAAIDMLNQKQIPGFALHLTRFDIFIWLSLCGLLGVLLAVPLRRHYIDDEALPFADGTAAGQTLMILDQDRAAALSQVMALNLGMLLSGIITALRDNPWRKVVPEAISLGSHGAALRVGTEFGLLSFGSGMIVGLRITLSMGLGMLLSWVIAPPLLVSEGVVTVQDFAHVLKWVMWPATGLLVSGGLMALILKWRVIARSFQGIRQDHVESGDLPIRFVALGALGLSVLICIFQHVNLGFPIWLSAVSIVLSFLLMLVGTRVLGETNWAPISSLANLMQAVFAALSPGNMAVNMIGSGMSGTIAANGEHLMQDYKAGKIVGSTNRYLTYLQLIGVPVGALAVAFVYPALRSQYGIGDGGALVSPISVKWAGFAELLNKGFSALPKGCFTALLVAVVTGSIISVLEPRYKRYLPSPTGMGIGMLIPGYATLAMVVGGVTQLIWSRLKPEHEAIYCVPLSSGFIAGEALVVLLLSIGALFAS